MSVIFESGIGYSIELNISKDWHLELKGEFEGLPLYESIGGKVTAIALVKKPAVKVKTMANDESRTLIGPVMIPNQNIFRNQGPIGPENCYWFFSSKTIEKFQKEFKGEIKLGH